MVIQVEEVTMRVVVEDAVAPFIEPITLFTIIPF
jgi:hypothetical protein